MKRRRKLVRKMTLGLCLVGIGLGFYQLQQNEDTPFPGAVLLLNDASWRSQWHGLLEEYRYSWTTPHTLLYMQASAKEDQLVKRHITPDGRVSAPEVLPLRLKPAQVVTAMSPDEKLLCLYKAEDETKGSYSIVRTDGKGKPVVVDSRAWNLRWLPDSKSLVGTPDIPFPQIVQHVNAATGSLTQTPLDRKILGGISNVTSDGKIIGYFFVQDLSTNPPVVEWIVPEIQGKHVVSTTYRKQLPNKRSYPLPSPDCKHLLWYIPDDETFDHPVVRWQITDIDGSNMHQIGITPPFESKPYEAYPHWTPDSKGIHFIKEKKLWYLAVP